jgi:hypothetical protein
MSLRRMLPFLFLNIIVSALVVLSILFWWERRSNPVEEALPEAIVRATLVAAQAALPTPGPAAGEAQVAESAPADAEAAAAADEGPVTHTVQAGDTLGRISTEYEVSMEDIMAANGIDNPNLLSVGQVLTIPVNGLPTPTSPAPEATAALPTPIPTQLAAAQGQAAVAISLIQGVGTLDEEVVQIVNNGAGPQPMQGWKLRDEDGNVYTFGQMSLFGEGAGLELHSRNGENTGTTLYWGLDEPAWRSGELATLWDAADQVVARFTVP